MVTAPALCGHEHDYGGVAYRCERAPHPVDGYGPEFRHATRIDAGYAEEVGDVDGNGTPDLLTWGEDDIGGAQDTEIAWGTVAGYGAGAATPGPAARPYKVEGEDGFDPDADFYPVSEHPDLEAAVKAAGERVAELDRAQPHAGGPQGIQDRVYVVYPNGYRQRIFSGAGTPAREAPQGTATPGQADDIRAERDHAEWHSWAQARGHDPDDALTTGDMHDAFEAGMQAQRDLAARERPAPGAADVCRLDDLTEALASLEVLVVDGGDPTFTSTLAHPEEVAADIIALLPEPQPAPGLRPALAVKLAEWCEREIVPDGEENDPEITSECRAVGECAKELAAILAEHGAPQPAPELGADGDLETLADARVQIGVLQDRLAAADRIARDILESLCRRGDVPLESTVTPGGPARNYELALRLGIGHVFGLDDAGPRAAPAPGEVVHACPPDGGQRTPCCGETPFDLPRTDRVTDDPALVTCGKPQPAPDVAADVDALIAERFEPVIKAETDRMMAERLAEVEAAVRADERAARELLDGFTAAVINVGGRPTLTALARDVRKRAGLPS